MLTVVVTIQVFVISLHLNVDLHVLATTISIPDPGFSVSGRKYIQVLSELEWAKASDVCINTYGGHLARANTLEEIAALKTFKTAESVADHFWWGLQWTNALSKVWNDGSCTPVSSLSNYKDANSDNFNANKQCFAAHGNDVQWEAFRCKDKKHFVCETIQTAAVENRRMEFHVILYENSDMSLCASLCLSLKNCFIASPIVNACVVALASASEDSIVITVGSAQGTTVASATSSAAVLSVPAPCVTFKASGSGVGTQTNIINYTTIDGTWSNEPDPCLQPPVSVVYVPQTVTETLVEMSTVVSQVPGQSCSSQPEYTTVVETHTTVVIEPTTVWQVHTTVVVETSVVPAYVTVTTQEVASCTPNIVTETTQICTESSYLDPTGTSLADGDEVSLRTLSPDETDQLRQEIYDALHVDPEELSKTTRAKNSAVNKLTSSVAIGFSFSLMGVIFVGIIVVSDMAAIFRHIKSRMIVNIENLCRD